MRKLSSERKRCLLCMEEHEVDTVEVEDTESFKDEDISFMAVHEYCAVTDEFLENEEMIRSNMQALKGAYRQQGGSKTTEQ